MEREGDEVHVETDEARGGSTPNIVRWVLAISLFAAIALMSVIWITGAATRDEIDEYVTVPEPSESAEAAAPAAEAPPPAEVTQQPAEAPADAGQTPGPTPT